MRNKALLYTRVESGNKQVLPIDIYEDELDNYKDVIKKEVFCKAFQRKLNTRVIKFGKLYIKALFFEDGKAYDVDVNGFKQRENWPLDDQNKKLHQELLNKQHESI